MSSFGGIPEELFSYCERSYKIRKPIAKLKELKAVLQPEMEKLNPAITGHVSRTKVMGTNEYNDWAWLYFSTIGRDAFRFSQLTVNMSPSALFAGVTVRTSSEYSAYKKRIDENPLLFEQILCGLSGREWIITDDGNWEKKVPRRFTTEELRGELLKPRLFWINATFKKTDSILRSGKIATEIFNIFRDLYNIYALASGNEAITQPSPKEGVFKTSILVESDESYPRSDSEDMRRIGIFLSSLKTFDNLKKAHLPGRNDQVIVRRTALEYDLRPISLNIGEETATIFSDKELEPFRHQIDLQYVSFSKLMKQIAGLLDLPAGFLKIAYVNPSTDARYIKQAEEGAVFVNLAHFEIRRNLFYWLFSISREISYVKTRRLGYPFVKELQRIVEFGLNNLGSSRALMP
jgi:hypothetical protein